MEFFKHVPNFDFMGWRGRATALSAFLVVVSIASLSLRGLNFAVDFTGGTLLELGFSESVDLTQVRQTMSDAGFEGASVQHLGTSHDILIRIGTESTSRAVDAGAVSNQIIDLLQQLSPDKIEVNQVEYVGPQVGDELAEQGILSVVAALGGILIYVAFRFQWRFAVGSVIALAHDVIIVMGVFSLFAIKFDLNVLAAVLAVTGYSLNDTIVVFDRAREDFRRLRNKSPEQVMNVAINNTLARTVMTGVTTLMVLVALIVLGGPTLFGFSLALIIGVVVGTWSSIYIAATAALALGVSSADLLVSEPSAPGRDE
jgi:preprotein translocase subunit SecF